MALTRDALLDLVNTYGGGDYNNIDHIVTTNSEIIRMSWYQVEGRGIQWVDKELSEGVYRTGIEFYGPIAHSVEYSLEENGAKTITFIDVEMIDRIAFKAPQPPSWAWKEPSKNANLSSLSIDGTPLEGFNKNTLTYNVELPHGTSEVPEVSAISEDPNSEVEIIQADSVTGHARVVVTAEDGTTTKTYTIQFSVAPNDDADLESIEIGGNPLEEFDKNTLNYNVELPFGTTDAPAVTALAEDSNATVDITQADSVTGTATIVVTAEDGTTTKTYTIQFSVSPPNNNANLDSISIGGQPLEQFDSDTLTYGFELPYGTTEVPEVTALAEDSNATVDITQADSVTGHARVVVTAEDGTTTKTYTIQFSVAPNNNANLESIEIGGNPLEEFDSDTLNYNVELPFGTTEVPEVTALAEDSNATVDITQADSPTGEAKIIVTAEDGTTTKTYTIQFSVAPNNNANLDSISIGGQPLEEFDSDTLNYNVELPFGTTDAPVVTATAVDSNATVDITQADSVTGTATIVVTAEDGTTTKTYTIQFSVAEEENPG